MITLQCHFDTTDDMNDYKTILCAKIRLKSPLRRSLSPLSSRGPMRSSRELIRELQLNALDFHPDPRQKHPNLVLDSIKTLAFKPLFQATIVIEWTGSSGAGQQLSREAK